MSDVGWISLHRKIQDCFLWDLKPFSWGQAWIDLLLLANHKDKKIVFDGNVITVKKGERITSIRSLCDRWGWSNTKVTRFLNILEQEQMIVRKSDTKKTLVSIVNYELYQTEIPNERHTSDTETSQKRTNNNDNNDNNDNKNIIHGDFSEEDFEKLWKMYPKKKGKGQISKTCKTKIAKIGFDRMAKAIENFKRDMRDKDEQYIMYGSTFFNSGYVDYLPQEEKKPVKEEPQDNGLTEEEIDAMTDEEYAAWHKSMENGNV